MNETELSAVMEFNRLFLAAASIIALTGLFFFIFGFRQFSSRRFGLTWKSLLREGWHEMTGNRQGSGRGTGLYFALFGLFMMLFCLGASIMLGLTRMIMHESAGPLPSPVAAIKDSD